MQNKISQSRAGSPAFWLVALLAMIAVSAQTGCSSKEESPAPAPAPTPTGAAATPAASAPKEAAEASPTPAEEPADETASAPPAAEPPAGQPPTAPAAPATPAASSAGAGLSGQATFTGPRPKRTVIAMTADPKCAAIHGNAKVGSEEEIVGANGELANVFVYVKAGVPAGAHAAPAAAAKLDQQGCMYSPHVLGIMAGQPLEIVNSDSLLHNVHALPKVNPEFNFGQPQPGTATRTFRKAEAAIRIKCDVHPWMGAWLFVMDHPFFAVTGRDGKFAIPSLPPGKYTIAAWHEKHGEKTMQVDTATAAEVSISFP